METIEQFISNMENTEQDECFQVGPIHSGRQRAMFKIDGMIWFMETHMPHNWTLPTTIWYHVDYSFKGGNEAQKVADQYNATIAEEPYSEAHYYLCFDEFSDMASFLYDRKHKQGYFNK